MSDPTEEAPAKIRALPARRATSVTPISGSVDVAGGALSPEYRETPHGLVWTTFRNGQTLTVPLTNFTARIILNERRDDGAEVRRLLTIQVRLGERVGVVTWRGEDLGQVDKWAMEALGPSAIVEPGQGTRDRVRVAVQRLSLGCPEREVFAHTGWRDVAGQRVYLHGGGALGAHGPAPDITVELDGLPNVYLPVPGDESRRRDVFLRSLDLLDLCDDTVTVPVFGAVWRSVFGNCRFVVWLVGRTGWGKSELAALAQQHFGPAMHAGKLPGSFADTANALVDLSFVAKDMLFVIDDFHPEGTRTDVAHLHATAVKMIRSAGNSAGRRRMNADTSLRVSRPPRALILATGEEMPQAHSVNARLVVVDLPGAIRFPSLSEFQRDAQDGIFGEAMAGFVTYLAGLSEDEFSITGEVAERRDARTAGAHRRSADNLANLEVGWRRYVAYGRAIGALDEQSEAAYMQRVRGALDDLAAAQDSRFHEADPVDRYLDALRSAVTTGDAYLECPGGGVPEFPDRWGWTGGKPGGRRIGWVKGDDVYLDPVSAFGEAQSAALRTGEPLAISEATLRRRLRDAGVLVSTEETRGVLTVRKVLGGARRGVLHISAGTFWPS